MTFVQKHRKEIFFIIALIALYFLTRLLFLTNLPIFTDEAIYIRWAQIALHDSNWRFISLTDGKPPLQTWIMLGFLKLIQDPLTAGRLVSVSSGFFSMVGLYFLTHLLFRNRTIAFLSCLLYVFYPLALLHDRLAIEDSLSALWYIWSLYFSILLIKKINLGTAYTLGFSLGAGVLTKSIGFISMALLPFLFILFDFKQKKYKPTFFKAISLAIIAVVIGLAMYGILRLSPLYGMVGTKNETFIYTLSDWLGHSMEWRLTLFSGNLTTMLQWIASYMNFMYIVFLIVGLALGRYWKEKLILVIYFLLPFLFDASFGKVIYPRYILFMTVVLLPIIAMGIYHSAHNLYQHHKKVAFTFYLSLLTLVTLLPTMYFSFLLIVNPLQAPVPAIDRFQYIVGWPAGWGVKETLAYIKEKSVNQKVYFAMQGTFGLTPAGFDMYLQNMPNVTTKGYWPIETTIPVDLLEQAKKMPTYIYFYEPCSNCPMIGAAPSGWPLTPVLTIYKDNILHATLYQVQAE